MLPKISIITVVRNDPKGLKLTLDSLCELAYPNLELVVVDGASTDSTPLVAQHYAPHIAHYLSEPDGGLYDAMNKGILLATGDYLWFVNAGDRALSGERLAELMTTDTPLSDIYYGEAMVVDSTGKKLGLRRKKPPMNFNKRSLLRGMQVSHQAFIVRRAIAPLYDLKYHIAADIEWQIACLSAAQSTRFTACTLCEFATGGLSSTRHRKALIERWHIMRSHYGLWVTTISHLRFIFDAILTPTYR